MTHTRTDLPRTSSPPQTRVARLGSLRDVVAFFGALLVAFALTAGLFAALGANPWDAFRAIATGAFGSSYSIRQTMYVATALGFTAIAALLPFRAGILNVGGDGQFALGAIASTAVIFSLGSAGAAVMISLAVIGGAVAGALWSGLAGWLRVKAGANEVIVGLMLNFIAALLADYVISGKWADSLAPQTKNLPTTANFPSLPGVGGNYATGVLVAVVVILGIWLLIDRSRFGFKVRVVGSNPDAGRRAGIGFNRVVLAVMLIGGACAGLGGVIQVTSVDHALISNPAQSYGYTGIAVALLAGLRPILVIPAALFFAALSVGANSLPAVTGISTSASLIAQGIFVIGLLAAGVIRIKSAKES